MATVKSEKINQGRREKSFQRSFSDMFWFALYLLVLLVAAIHLPKSVTKYYDTQLALIGFGVIGTWRYCWWLNHIIRAFIYGYIIFPRRRLKADHLWASGWRPKRLLFMMTTFQELQTTTETVLQSILNECMGLAVPITLFIGTGADSDEANIESFFAKQKVNFSFEVVIVRQKKPGKRYAIGETLRAMVRHGLSVEDLVVFMDGDTFFEPGCLRLCLPFFQLYPKMQALTTHEKAIVNGPVWVKKWLDMRFSQRDFTMQSYALSNKILTLTGRMSMFRGKHLCEPGFIQIIENDHLTHWLWGEYRFLSGDDKSTWYYLLKERADMFYIPDAVTVTIEYIRGNAVDRMIENLRRWNGNTLRNGARAMQLGPRTTGFFIWWCLVDQRCTIWTMLVGHMMIIILALSSGAEFLLVAFLWIAFSRLCMSCMLFIHARRIDMSFPFLLYINQFMSTIIKLYIVFRLPQQRWKNRGDQHAGFAVAQGNKLKSWVATYLTIFYCTCCLVLILIRLKLIGLPSMGDIRTLF